MKHETGIEWTHWPLTKGRTWIPVTGCAIDGRTECINCYAMKLSGTRLKSQPAYAGLTRTVNGNIVWTGQARVLPERLTMPLAWRAPSTIFLTSMGDLFHKDVPDEALDTMFAVMCATQRHRYIIASKRTPRMVGYAATRAKNPDPIRAAAARLGLPIPDAFPPRNIWWGTSAGTQAAADFHVNLLAESMAYISPGRAWVSYEPALERVDFSRWVFGSEPVCPNCPWDVTGPDRFKGLNGCCLKFIGASKLAWIVVGGESDQHGRRGREFDADWALEVVSLGRAAGVPVFVKQLGGWPVNVPGNGIPLEHRTKHNGDWDHWPESIRVRQFPLSTLPELQG